MKRKEFLQTGLATGALMGSSAWASASMSLMSTDTPMVYFWDGNGRKKART